MLAPFTIAEHLPILEESVQLIAGVDFQVNPAWELTAAVAFCLMLRHIFVRSLVSSILPSVDLHERR